MPSFDINQLNYFRDEYGILQKQYEDFDGRALVIKGWIGLGSLITFGVSLGNVRPIPEIVCVCVLTMAASFWVLESFWKMFQYSISDRIRFLEAIFRGEDDALLFHQRAPFQIYDFWFRSWSRDEPIYESERRHRPRTFARRFLQAAFQPFVMLPYLPLIGITLVILFLLIFTTAIPGKV